MLQIDNIDETIARKRELQKLTEDLDNYTEEILEKKRWLLGEIDKVTSELIRPLKDEVSQLDAEIEKIMKETGQTRLTSDTYGAYLSDEISIKITDKAKAWEWIQKNPQVLKKDILKASEVNKLIKDGQVPDPIKDGVDCNDTYQKITYRRR